MLIIVIKETLKKKRFSCLKFAIQKSQIICDCSPCYPGFNPLKYIFFLSVWFYKPKIRGHCHIDLGQWLKGTLLICPDFSSNLMCMSG